MDSGGTRCAERQSRCVQRKQHKKHRGSAQTAEGPSGFLQETQGSPCVSKSQGVPAAAPGQGAAPVSALQSRRGTQRCPLHTLVTSQLQRLLQHVSPSPWNTSTHTHKQLLPTPLEGTHGTLTAGQLEMIRQKQRSPCAPLRNSVSVNAWCKVQAWLIPGVHERPPTPRGQTHLLCSLQRQRALVCEEAEAGPWDVHSARILPTPASRRSAQVLVPRRVGVPERP